MAYTNDELRNMLYDVVDELNLSEAMLEKHGPHGTAPAVLVRVVLAQKDLIINALRHGFVDVSAAQQAQPADAYASAKAIMDTMTDADRLDLIHEYCQGCGSKETSCCCMRDD